MFTGIVEAVGEIVEVGRPVAAPSSGASLWIRSPVLGDAPMGASVAVDGVCLTVAGIRAAERRFDLSPETLARSTLGAKAPGEHVNLERPMRIGDELGGHLVQGHVDGVGRITSVTDDTEGRRVRVAIPGELTRYVVEKGSVTLDGVSLTVTGVDGDTFGVALIPHTLQVTTFGVATPGKPVNVEVDVLAKYVERLAEPFLRRVAPAVPGEGSE